MKISSEAPWYYASSLKNKFYEYMYMTLNADTTHFIVVSFEEHYAC